MKNTFFYIFSLIFFMFSCKKKNVEENESVTSYEPLTYDTTAIDSFSSGAVSVDVAEQIRKSSIAYQDSVKKVALEQEKARIAQEEENKKKEEERVKQEAAKKEDAKKSETQPKAEENPQ